MNGHRYRLQAAPPGAGNARWDEAAGADHILELAYEAGAWLELGYGVRVLDDARRGRTLEQDELLAVLGIAPARACA